MDSRFRIEVIDIENFLGTDFVNSLLKRLS